MLRMMYCQLCIRSAFYANKAEPTYHFLNEKIINQLFPGISKDLMRDPHKTHHLCSREHSRTS